jgi:hypothetical protein
MKFIGIAKEEGQKEEEEGSSQCSERWPSDTNPAGCVVHFSAPCILHFFIPGYFA